MSPGLNVAYMTYWQLHTYNEPGVHQPDII